MQGAQKKIQNNQWPNKEIGNWTEQNLFKGPDG
jgi:hypothetical protein